MAGKYETFQDKRGEHRFRLKAGNGEIILTGEGYKAKSGCENGIASVQKNSPDAGQYSRKESESGKHSFVLKAKNNQVIGQSQSYNSAASMENGIKSVMSNGPSDRVEVATK